MKTNYRQFLKTFTQLNDEIVEMILGICESVSYPPSTILSSPGSNNYKAALLTSGACKFYQTSNNGAEIIFNFYIAPAFIPYSATGFFLKTPSQVYCETLTKVEGLELNAEDLLDLANKEPSVYEFLLRIVAQAYQRRQNKEFCFLEKSSKERYLRFMELHPHLIEIVPLKSLASFLQIQPGSLSRIRKELRS